MSLPLHWLALLILWKDAMIDQILFNYVTMTDYGIQCHTIIILL